jgi:hypothetical protein
MEQEGERGPKDWREFWIPGERIRGEELRREHVVIATLFTGEENAGVVWSQHPDDDTDHVVWDVTRRGVPRVHAPYGSTGEARQGFRGRVAEILAAD